MMAAVEVSLLLLAQSPSGETGLQQLCVGGWDARKTARTTTHALDPLIGMRPPTVKPNPRTCSALAEPFASAAALRGTGNRGTPLERAAFGRIVIARSEATRRSRSCEAPFVPLDCFAIARPEGRASFDALGSKLNQGVE